MRLAELAAVRRWLGLGARRSIPVVLPYTVHDCGAACLAMVLGYHGRSVRVDDIRELTGTGRHGSTAAALLTAGERFGLTARGFRLEVEDLAELPPAAILHWNFNHFVVFERMRRGGAQIIDPACGRCVVPLSQLRTSFTGVTLLFEPGDGFRAATGADSSARRFLGLIFDGPSDWIRIVVTSFALQLSGLGLPIVTSKIVDDVVPRGEADLLGALAVCLALLVAFYLLCTLLRANLLIFLRARIDARLTLVLLHHLISLPYPYFQSRSAGDLIQRLNNNATIREILSSSVLSALIDGSLVVVYFTALAALNPVMAAVVLGLGLLQVGAHLLTRARQRDLIARTIHVQARSEGYQFEMLAGMETLKAMGCERRAADHWTNIFLESLNIGSERSQVNALLESIVGAVRLASPLLVLLLGASQVLRGDFTLGVMLGLCAVAGSVLGPLGNLIATGGQLQVLSCHLDRVRDTLAAEPEQPTWRALTHPLRGEVDLHGACYRYCAQAPLVVKDVTLKVRPGEFVAIVGRSGCGKSTLASLIAGLYAPTEGEVRYDGVDRDWLDLTSLRRQLGVVTQRPFLFATSIRDNIALADPQMPESAVIEAATLAGIHEEIMAMRLGYETILLDGGSSLSGGQRQRIVLARALAAKPSILVLDEATSALDALVERRIQDNLAALSCTRIILAHRFSTVIGADTILVMEDGVITQRGSHEQLLAEGGAYAELLAAQLDGCEPS